MWGSFRILHLSDLHIDSIPGFASLIIHKIKDLKFALVHTSELARVAADHTYDLYLCGHTHGGQICLKKGLPVISHQFEGRKFNHGLWKSGKMTGYTSRGAGVSGIPVRFNCPPEVTIINLLN